MPFLGKRYQRREVDLGLLVRIRKELQSKYSRPENWEYVFIHPHDARSVLTRERVKELLKNFKWYNEDDRTEIWRTMSLILCILITIEWTEWTEFKTFFAPTGDYLRSPRFTDDDLPLKDVSFLPPNIQDDFKREQYLFKPIVIEQNSHAEYSQRYRLPISKVETVDEPGVQGDVDKIYLEKGYLYCTDQHNTRSFNDQVRAMARKRVAIRSSRSRQKFELDKLHLEQFRKCLQNHQNIMQSFASFVHGHDFVILTPWADGRDLQKFLYSPEEILDDFPERSGRFTPHNVMIEAYSLAQGLDFIHSQMVTDKGRRTKCGHVDLKPENVLVCFPETGNAAGAPVGRWKIVDFSISNVEETVAGPQIVQLPPSDQYASLAPGTILRDLAAQPFKRGPGAFQPPEVKNQQTAKVSTRRDVWSFGCILAMVLAFAIGGPEEVNAQLLCRSRGADDYFYHRLRRVEASHHSGTVDSKHAELKPAIRHWLEEKAPSLTPQIQRDWVRYTTTLILKLLTINVCQRPEMNFAVFELERILMWTEVYGTDRIWHFDGASTAPEVVSQVPEVKVLPERSSVSSATGQHQPFLGVPSETISSSGPLSTTFKSSSTKGSTAKHFKHDGTLSFARLEVPANCEGGCLSSSVRTAALWSKSEVYVYELGFLRDDSELWRETPRCEELKTASLKDSFSGIITVPHTARCFKVLLAGSFLAILQQQGPSGCIVRLFQRQHGKQNAIQEYQTIPFSQKPQDVKLSRKGFCLIHVTDKLQLHTPGGSTTIPLGEKDVMDFAFSGDGEYFCLWERDRNYHYWSVWGADLKLVRGTIRLKHEAWQPQTSSLDAHLLPFRSYPRFIACDRSHNVYLIRADLSSPASDRALQLGRTDNVFSGLVLPSDDGFILIRASQHSNQKVERFSLSSLSGVGTFFKPYACGYLYKDVDRRNWGVAVRGWRGGEDEGERTTCLVTLSPNGRLVRKVL